MNIRKIFMILIIYLFITNLCYAGDIRIVYDDGENPLRILKLKEDNDFISFRELFQGVGYDVRWDHKKQIAIAGNKANIIQVSMSEPNRIIIKNRSMTISRPIDIPIVQYNDSIFISTRALEQSNILDFTKTDKEFFTIKLEHYEQEEDQKGLMTSYDTLTEDVSFSFEKKDFNDIIKYIQENYDKNFDISCYNVEINVNSYINEIPFSGKIIMNLLKDGFSTEHGFEIYIYGGYVTSIIFHDTLPEQRENKKYIEISEEKLENIVYENLFLEPNERVIEQEIQKKYDNEPYYQVKTIIYDNMNFSRMEIFIYRLSEIKF